VENARTRTTGVTITLCLPKFQRDRFSLSDMIF